MPEEWLIERIQQVGANSCNLLSPSFIVICGIFAAVFCNLRYIFVTASRSSRKRQGANPVAPQRWAGSCKLPKLADCIIVTNVLPPEQAPPLFAYSQLGHVVQTFRCFFCVVERTLRIGLVGPCPAAAFQDKPEVEAFSSRRRQMWCRHWADGVVAKFGT